MKNETGLNGFKSLDEEYKKHLDENCPTYVPVDSSEPYEVPKHKVYVAKYRFLNETKEARFFAKEDAKTWIKQEFRKNFYDYSGSKFYWNISEEEV